MNEATHWRGKRIEDLTKDEMISAIKQLAWMERRAREETMQLRSGRAAA